MSEQEKVPLTGYWSREGDGTDQGQYETLIKMETYQDIKAKAGHKVTFDGVLYYNEVRNTGRVLGVVSEQAGAGHPVFVNVGMGLPAIPAQTPVRVRGELAGEPWANAG